MEINIGHLRDKTLEGQAGDLARGTDPAVFLSVCHKFETSILGAKCQKTHYLPMWVPIHQLLHLHYCEKASMQGLKLNVILCMETLG